MMSLRGSQSQTWLDQARPRERASTPDKISLKRRVCEGSKKAAFWESFDRLFLQQEFQPKARRKQRKIQNKIITNKTEKPEREKWSQSEAEELDLNITCKDPRSKRRWSEMMV